MLFPGPGPAATAGCWLFLGVPLASLIVMETPVPPVELM